MNPPSKEFRDKAAAEISDILKEVPTVRYRDENGTLVLLNIILFPDTAYSRVSGTTVISSEEKPAN